MFYGDLNRWFIGVVKNINDPITSGRVQVRIFGIHGSSQENIPDKKLPWAQVLAPVTEGGTSGLGNILGIQVGARVFGIFLDGKNSQMPLILGSIPHDEQSSTLSGGDNYVTTNIKAQGTSDVTITEQQLIEEPLQKLLNKPVYPHNKVTQTSSGHFIEIDDTPPDSDGNRYERIRIYHRTGTFLEMQPNGDIVTQHASGYRSVTGNDRLYASGDVDWFVEGNVVLRSKKNITLSADENIKFTSTKNLTSNIHGNIDLRAGGKIDLNTSKPTEKFEWAVVEEPEGSTPGGGPPGMYEDGVYTAASTPVDNNGNEIVSVAEKEGLGKSGPSSNSLHPDSVMHDAVEKKLLEPGDGKCTRPNLGDVSAKWESNGDAGIRGFDKVGGYSYGSHQIATSRGKEGTGSSSMNKFINSYLKTNYADSYYKELTNAGGEEAAFNGTTQFEDTWKNLGNDPEFAKAQYKFIKKANYETGVDNILSSTGLDICDGSWSDGVQDAVFSTAVQHGGSDIDWVMKENGGKWNGAPKVLQGALERTGKYTVHEYTTNEDGYKIVKSATYTGTQQELIDAIYDERMKDNGTAYFKNSTSDIQKAVVKRLNLEKNEARVMDKIEV